jgi:hypothetical protein
LTQVTAGWLQLDLIRPYWGWLPEIGRFCQLLALLALLRQIELVEEYCRNWAAVGAIGNHGRLLIAIAVIGDYWRSREDGPGDFPISTRLASLSIVDEYKTPSPSTPRTRRAP